MAWLCTVDGDCRPVEAAYPTRGKCLIAERNLKHMDTQLRAIQCRHMPGTERVS